MTPISTHNIDLNKSVNLCSEQANAPSACPSSSEMLAHMKALGGWIAEFARRYEVRTETLGDLEHAIVELQNERERFKQDHLRSCEMIAAMHAAARGGVVGPNRGVVEDVEDLRLERDRLKLELNVSQILHRSYRHAMEGVTPTTPNRERSLCERMDDVERLLGINPTIKARPTPG